MKPQLAKDAPIDKDGNLKVRFPVVVQTKFDGIRCVIIDGRAVTRTLKEIPNREIFDFLSRPEFNGLDGEIIVGDPAEQGCYGRTTSFVMSRDKTNAPWSYYVFDKWDHSGVFTDRVESARKQVMDWASSKQSEPDVPERTHKNVPLITLVGYTYAHNLAQLSEKEEELVAEGHEGIIVRNPSSLYKYGRSGMTIGEALKVKRFKDGEAVVLEMYERLHNANEATTDLLGRTERSSHKANKHGRGDLGGFVVEEIVGGSRTGRTFKVGTGFNDQQRAAFWGDASIIGRTIKFKHFEVGSKDLPRFPVFLGFRDAIDM